MANLPADCVDPRSPLEAVGVDFTGAFNIRCNFHHTIQDVKAYVLILVCMITRAVHIELIPSLSIEKFLNTLKCFITRRGIPRIIDSNNGTNFCNAERYHTSTSNTQQFLVTLLKTESNGTLFLSLLLVAAVYRRLL